MALVQVLPELQSPRINDVPILKADAIKFVTTFRSVADSTQPRKLVRKVACASLERVNSKH